MGKFLWCVSTVLILSLVHGFFSPFETRSEAVNRHGFQPTMMAFSQAIIGIQKALAAGDTEGVSIHATALENTTKEVSNLKPHSKNKAVSHAFDGYRTRIEQLTSELVSTVGAEQFAKVSQIAHEIRHTCVSCHVKFRGDRDEYGLFPSLGNVITGEVKILKLDGQERADRSNVVVFLDRVHSDTGFSLPRQNPVISQKNRVFTPRVLAVMKGTTVDMPNDDTIFHNLFSLNRIVDPSPFGKGTATARHAFLPKVTSAIFFSCRYD